MPKEMDPPMAKSDKQGNLITARHGKRSNPSADTLVEYYKFPQISGHKFQQKGLICDKT